jgi:hypothetical protein
MSFPFGFRKPFSIISKNTSLETLTNNFTPLFVFAPSLFAPTLDGLLVQVRLSGVGERGNKLPLLCKLKQKTDKMKYYRTIRWRLTKTFSTFVDKLKTKNFTKPASK